jgi:hypothetical protein
METGRPIVDVDHGITIPQTRGFKRHDGRSVYRDLAIFFIDDFSIMWTAFRLFLKQFFCTHQWVATDVRRYSVSPLNKQPEGEVSMAFLRCKKCGAEFHRIADPSQGER